MADTLQFVAADNLRNEIDRLAREEKRSRSQMIWILLTEALEARKAVKQ